MFVDRAKIKVSAGHGGGGCVSFRREKFVPKGGPDGGDGGHGGTVIFRASPHVQSLVAMRYMPHYEGGNGEPGKGRNRHGANGADKVVQVPLGTVFYDAEDQRQLADLSAEGEEFRPVRPGRGGLGNARFASSTNQAPRTTKPATRGEEKTLLLELKTVADVGLIGFPNAGKSSLLAAISDAHPKTAPYPFTTLHPQVGVVRFSDFFRFTVADIPGLIEGAHDNVGLGHNFLRHIERCRVFVFVLDVAGVDGRVPWEDFAALQKELALYRADLVERPSLIVANKSDLPEFPENLSELRRRLPDQQIIPLCATTGDKRDQLAMALRAMLEQETPD